MKTIRQHVDKVGFFSTFTLRSLMCLKIRGESPFQNMNMWVTTELMVNALKWKCCHIALNCRGIKQQQKTDLFVLHTPQH